MLKLIRPSSTSSSSSSNGNVAGRIGVRHYDRSDGAFGIVCFGYVKKYAVALLLCIVLGLN